MKQCIIVAKARTSTVGGINYQHNSLQSFCEDLQSVDGLTAKLLNSSSKSQHDVIYNKQLVEEFNNFNDIFVDATFKTRPRVKGATQLLTIMGKNSIL